MPCVREGTCEKIEVSVIKNVKRVGHQVSAVLAYKRPIPFIICYQVVLEPMSPLRDIYTKLNNSGYMYISRPDPIL